MNRIAVPADLNGSMIAVLLPLRTTLIPALVAEPMPGSAGPDDAPFLASRAQLIAPSGSRRWELKSAFPRYDAWAAPVLLAHSRRSTSDQLVVFGRSASTVAESQETDQPLVLPESAAASLWLVPGIGLVLGLERLMATHGVAETTDRVGRLLRLPAPGADRNRSTYHAPDSAKGVAEALHELSVPPDASLQDLFPGQVEDLASVLPCDKPILQSLVPSQRVRAGHRMVEGLVVGLGAAERGSDLRVDSLLFRRIEGDEVGFDESDEWQTEGYRWDFESFQPTTEPARPDALCAMRSDGRVVVVDLDALSIYHDYLGGGSDGIVRELIPLAAVAGQLAADQADVVDQLSRLAADGDLDDAALSDALGLARRVRARLELRSLQQPQLLHEKNFRAWTVDESLRREMAPRAMQDQLSADGSSVSGQMEALARSVDSLEEALQRNVDEVAVTKERKRDDERAKLRTAINFVFGLITAAGLVAVFTSLASVPGPAARAVPSLASAGLWTMLALAAFALMGGVGFVLVEGTLAIPGRRSHVAVPLLLLAGVGAGLGLLASTSVQVFVLSGACLIVVAASLLVLLDLRDHRLRERGVA